MKLYARRSSSNSQKTLWLLGELGLEYEFVATGGDAGGLDSPSYLALNPHGKVPVWEDHNGAVWESHAILRYLAATYGLGKWWPVEPIQRSHVDRWMDWSQAGFDQKFMSLFWGYWRTPVPDRDTNFIDQQIQACHELMQLLDHALSNSTYLVGETLTLADIPVGALMYRYANLGMTSELPENVDSWYQALCQRPAYREHIMLPFDDLLGRLAY